MRAGTHGLCLALVAATGLVGLSVAGCGSQAPTPRTESAASLPVAPAALADNGMEILWQTPTLLAPSTRLTDLWLCGDFVVGHGSDNRLYVVSAATGMRLWSEQVAAPHEAVWPPTAYKTDLWVATTTRLIGYQGFDGKRIGIGLRETDGYPMLATDREQRGNKRDSLELSFAPAGRPATNGTHVFIPDGKGWLQAVSITPAVISWGRWTEDAVTAGPVLDSSLVYFGGCNGVVYASNQNIRRVVWEHQLEGAIVADLKRTDTGLILVGSLDYSLYAFQGASGAQRWRYNAGERIRRAPYALGGQAYIFTEQAGMTALDETNGHIVWRLPEGDDVLAANAQTVYVRSRGNDVLAVNRADGKVRFGVPLRRGTIAAPNETGTGIMYLAGPDGQIIALASKQEVLELAEKGAKEEEAAKEKAAKPATPEVKPAAPAETEEPAAPSVEMTETTAAPAVVTPPAAKTPAEKPAARTPRAKKEPTPKAPPPEKKPRAGTKGAKTK